MVFSRSRFETFCAWTSWSGRTLSSFPSCYRGVRGISEIRVQKEGLSTDFEKTMEVGGKVPHACLPDSDWMFPL